jgi:hypothetical protein
MWRHFVFVILIALLNSSLMAQDAQEANLPFIYVFGRMNFHVMDALSAEILYQIESEAVNCPVGISDDGHWLAYAEDDHNYLVNLQSAMRQSMDTTDYPMKAVWSSSHHLAAFLYSYGNHHIIRIYETRTNRQIFESDFWSRFGVAIRFDRTDLVYAFVDTMQGESVVYLSRANAYRTTTLDFTVDSVADWSDLSLSPNGRFLLGTGENTVNIIDLESGVIWQAGETVSSEALQWIPNQGAILVYIVENEAQQFQLRTYNPSLETEASINATYSLSLSLDGSFAVYSMYDANSNLRSWLMDTTNGETRELDSNMRNSIEWLSPNQFVYSAENSNAYDFGDIYLYNATTGESLQLTNTDEVDEYLLELNDPYRCVAG